MQFSHFICIEICKIYLRVLLMVSFGNIVHQVNCYEQDSHPDFPDEPLILTPLLESGKVEEAQQKSRVTPDINGVRSFTGFFNVNKICGNNLFFWFVPAEKIWEDVPVLLWLNGGPGASSLIGLFTEVGPFRYVSETKRLEENKNRWTKEFNVIFLDQPVGTGFSYTKKACYIKDITGVVQEVHSAVEQFFILFPNLQKNDFFLVGESFSGTFQSALGVEIDRKNSNAIVKLNFKGILVGNPFIDLRCHNYASYWYETGIIEEDDMDRILKYQEIRNSYIKNNNRTGAITYEDKIWNYMFNNSSLPSPYNILYDKDLAYDFQYFVNTTQIRKQIKVGNGNYNASSYQGIVGNLLRHDMTVSATPNIKTLLEKKYFVGFYTGQLDLVCPYSSTACVLKHLNHQEYQNGKRRGWYVNGRLAGWVRQGGNLLSVVIRGSGHMVPNDQGEVALALLKGVIGSYPVNKLDLAEEE